MIKLVNKVLKIRQNKNIIDIKELELYFIDRNGIEIGGPSSYFSKNALLPIYDKIKTLDCVNFAASTIWTGSIDENVGFVVDGKRLGKQYILDAVDLTPIAANSYDFFLSCNNIEHIANPMKAMEQWLSVLKKGGILLIIAPKKDVNFDHRRKVVTFEHLLDDFRNNVKEDDLTHLEEILNKHDLKLDPPAGTTSQFKERSLNNFHNRCLHHHVFDQNVLRQLFEYFDLTILKNFHFVSDYIIIGKK